LGLCTGPCEEKINKQDYADNVAKAVMVLKGNNPELVKQLRIEMKTAAGQRDFETATERRDQMFALQRGLEKQKVNLDKPFNQDVINFVYHEGNTFIQLFNITRGVISRRQSFKLDYEEPLDSFIKQSYYFTEIPQEIILPRRLTDHASILGYLTELRGKKVFITVPTRGTKKALLELVMTNIQQNFSDEDRALVELGYWLNLPTTPNNIECFDISNLGATAAVGSMVHFTNGKPDKNNYRRFKIRTVTGQDDFSMMAEVVRRRYTRLLAEHAPFPDLIVIDGGKGQLHAAVDVLEDLRIKIPIIGLAKKHEEVFEPGFANPKRLPLKDPRIKLLQRIRNEAHRFAITYHRLRREKI
jgi:excinuclease ABC subunit C